MNLNRQTLDRAATLLGLILAFVQSSTVDYPALMRGDSTALAQLGKAALFALLGYVANKRPAETSKQIIDDVTTHYHRPAPRQDPTSAVSSGRIEATEPFPGAYPFLAVAVALIFCGIAGAQVTKPTADQIKTASVTQPSLYVLLPTSKGMQLAIFDSSAFVVDQSGPVAVIRAIAAPGPTFAEVWNETARPGNMVASYTLAKPTGAQVVSSLRVYLNGLRLTPGVDYQLAGTLITFLQGQLPQAGDVLTCDYRYQ